MMSASIKYCFIILQLLYMLSALQSLITKTAYIHKSREMCKLHTPDSSCNPTTRLCGRKIVDEVESLKKAVKNESKRRKNKAEKSIAAASLENDEEKSLVVDVRPVNDVMLKAEETKDVQPKFVPPEVLFFGEPRNPPSAEKARDVKFHGHLLRWARHASVAPASSADRLATVYPKGRYHSLAPTYRLNDNELTFAVILQKFKEVSSDLEASKAFINSNVDLVPPALFLRSISAAKLSAQSQNKLNQMSELINLRSSYILASHQLFFPANIEVNKAETRVMTYLSNQEMRSYAQDWDEVELSLHFTVLLGARTIWDSRARLVLEGIEERVTKSVNYLANGLRKELMFREFRKPGMTSDVYRNASLLIQNCMTDLYKRVRPEVRLVHETYSLINDREEVIKYAKDFCAKEDISLGQIKERLRFYGALIAAIEGSEYNRLRVQVEDMYYALCTPEEADRTDKWYVDFLEEADFGFKSYEPDVILAPLEVDQRVRKSENAFTNYATDVFNAPPAYSEALSGERPKASSVGDWLKRDPAWSRSAPFDSKGLFEEFKEAFIKQNELRKKAGIEQGVIDDKKLQKLESYLLGLKESKVLEISDE